jgi:16S rRNA (uracil1498-N3)-methyltransferase
MSTTRLFSPVALHANAATTLGDEQARYIGKVLRLKPGDPVNLFDGSGTLFAATVVTVRKSEVVVQTAERLPAIAESPLTVHLLQGVSRSDRMDFVIQKATELGVGRITPVLCEFSVVKLNASRAARRQQHWAKIAISACEQCGRNLLPQIDAPVALRDWFGEHASQDASWRRLMLAPGGKQTLRNLDLSAGSLTLLVGPEGGLSPVEHERATQCGFEALGLGPRILRTETAAIAALAALQTLYGDLGGTLVARS